MQIITEVMQVLGTGVLSIVTLFVLTRLSGKRQIAQMSTFDYINSITIGSIAAELATDLEQWYRSLTALVLYGVVTWLVHMAACKSVQARQFLCGRASVLMENGTIYKKELAKAGIDLNEFLGQARVAGYFDLNEIDTALMETSGQISFLPKSANRPATPQDLELRPDPASRWLDLILDGKLQWENLRQSGRDEKWLAMMLERADIGQTGEAFYAACDKDGNFFACRGQ